MKQKIFNLIVIVLLLSCAFARLIVDNNNTKWIKGITILGFFISVFTLYFELYRQNKNNKRFAHFTGWFIIICIILLFLSVLISLRIIPTTNRFDDIVMIVTLLISLPSVFYQQELTNHFNRK